MKIFLSFIVAILLLAPITGLPCEPGIKLYPNNADILGAPKYSMIVLLDGKVTEKVTCSLKDGVVTLDYGPGMKTIVIKSAKLKAWQIITPGSREYSMFTTMHCLNEPLRD